MLAMSELFLLMQSDVLIPIQKWTPSCPSCTLVLNTPVQATTFLIHLVIRSSAHWELKATNTAGQFSVHLRVSIESVVHTAALLLIENDLQDLASVLLCSESLSNNLDWVNDVGENGLVDRGQSSAARTLLSLRGARSVGSLGAGEDATRSDEQNVAVGELLLELTGQTLLNLVEAAEERDGDEDNDRTLAVADFEL